jgi:hypothetical protein
MVVIEVERGWMPVPLTQKRMFRALAVLIARQKIPLHLPKMKKLSDEQKWYLFETYMQKHLGVPKRHEKVGIQAFVEDCNQGMKTIQILA